MLIKNHHINYTIKFRIIKFEVLNPWEHFTVWYILIFEYNWQQHVARNIMCLVFSCFRMMDKRDHHFLEELFSHFFRFNQSMEPYYKSNETYWYKKRESRTCVKGKRFNLLWRIPNNQRNKLLPSHTIKRKTYDD